jgi:hypothetical protein
MSSYVLGIPVSRKQGVIRKPHYAWMDGSLLDEVLALGDVHAVCDTA